MASQRPGGKTTGARGTPRRGQAGGATGQPAARDPASTPGTAPKAPPRRGRGFEPAAATLGQPLGEAAARYGFAEPAVLLHWAEIAGPQLAPLCRPVKVIHGRARDLSRTLLVACEGAVAPLVEYRAAEIVARVNAHYGYGAIARLKITQTGLDQVPAAHAGPAMALGMAEDAPCFEGPGRAGRAAFRRAEPRPVLTPTAEAEARAADRAAGVEDEDLRAALARFGAYVITKPRRD